MVMARLRRGCGQAWPRLTRPIARQPGVVYAAGMGLVTSVHAPPGSLRAYTVNT